MGETQFIHVNEMSPDQANGSIAVMSLQWLRFNLTSIGHDSASEEIELSVKRLKPYRLTLRRRGHDAARPKTASSVTLVQPLRLMFCNRVATLARPITGSLVESTTHERSMATRLVRCGRTFARPSLKEWFFQDFHIERRSKRGHRGQTLGYWGGGWIGNMWTSGFVTFVYREDSPSFWCQGWMWRITSYLIDLRVNCSSIYYLLFQCLRYWLIVYLGNSYLLLATSILVYKADSRCT